MKKILIFIGPPGSGKGTQAKLFAARHHYTHVSSGDLLRAMFKKKNPDVLERKALSRLKKGQLVPDELIYRLVFLEIEKNMKQGKGVVLDGAIRSHGQAVAYEQFFKDKGWDKKVLAVEVAISDRESYNRLTKRRMCKKCGEIIPWLPQTKNLKKCPKCGGPLVLRNDDNQKVIRKRIRLQGNAALRPILSYYRKLKMIKKVDGSKSIEEVEKEINRVVGS